MLVSCKAKKETKDWQLALPKQVNLRLNSNDVQALATHVLPSQFIGSDRLRPGMTYGSDLLNRKAETLEELVNSILYQHRGDLEPLVLAIKDFIASENDGQLVKEKAAIAQSYIDEISMRISKKQIDLFWLSFVHFRYLIAMSDVSEPEYELFRHFSYPNLLKGFTALGHETDFVKILLSLGLDETFDGRTITQPYSPTLSYKIWEQIDEELMKYSLVNRTFPMLGTGKAGVSFMVQCYLQNISIIGMPSQKKRDGRLPAHGVRMSVGPFALHDLAHQLVDSRMAIVRAHIFKAADYFVKKGGDATDLVRAYTPIALHKYFTLMNAFLRLQQLLMRFLLATNDQQAYKKAMLGFFYITHEYPVYDDSIFQQNDLSFLISKAIDYTILVLFDPQMWESAEDPLMTSPIDGASHLGANDQETKAKIAQYVFSEILIKNNLIALTDRDMKQMLNLPSDQQEAFKRKKIKEKIKAININLSELFIDVEFKMRDGNAHKFPFPTLKFKWGNLDDTLGLLKMAGVLIKKPDLSDMSFEQSRIVVRQTLDDARARLVGCIEYFKALALSLANTKGVDNMSLTDQYFKWHFNLQTNIDQLAEKSLTKIKASKPRYVLS